MAPAEAFCVPAESNENFARRMGGRRITLESRKTTYTEAEARQKAKANCYTLEEIKADLEQGQGFLLAAILEEQEEHLRGVLTRIFTHHCTDNPEACDDFVQEVLQKIIEVGRLRPTSFWRNQNGASLRTWLYKVAINHVREMKRKLKRRPDEVSLEQAEEESRGFQVKDPRPQLVEVAFSDVPPPDLLELLKRARLTTLDIEVYLKHYFSNCQVWECAQDYGVTQQAIYARLKKAQQKIDRLIGNESGRKKRHEKS